MRNIKKLKKKEEGKSQFIRSKLEKQYRPSLRVKVNKSPYQRIQKKKQYRLSTLDRENIKKNAIESMKDHKKLVIDWSTKTNFRITNFPQSTPHKITNQKRIKTEPIQNSRESLENSINQRRRSLAFGIIDNKSKFLSSLMEQQKQGQGRLFKQRRSSLKQRIKETNTCLYLPPSIKLKKNNPSINLLPPLEYKSFINQNRQKICETLQCEAEYFKNEQMMEQQNNNLKKEKIKKTNYHDKILLKSKLTLMKINLMRKFNDVVDKQIELELERSHKKKNRSEASESQIIEDN